MRLCSIKISLCTVKNGIPEQDVMEQSKAINLFSILPVFRASIRAFLCIVKQRTCGTHDVMTRSLVRVRVLHYEKAHVSDKAFVYMSPFQKSELLPGIKLLFPSVNVNQVNRPQNRTHKIRQTDCFPVI